MLGALIMAATSMTLNTPNAIILGLLFSIGLGWYSLLRLTNPHETKYIKLRGWALITSIPALFCIVGGLVILLVVVGISNSNWQF